MTPPGNHCFTATAALTLTYQRWASPRKHSDSPHLPWIQRQLHQLSTRRRPEMRLWTAQIPWTISQIGNLLRISGTKILRAMMFQSEAMKAVYQWTYSATVVVRSK